jgi:hypothetical protein
MQTLVLLIHVELMLSAKGKGRIELSAAVLQGGRDNPTPSVNQSVPGYQTVIITSSARESQGNA